MKVIEVSPTFPPNIGGIETHVHLLSKCLKDRGFDIEVFATDPNSRRTSYDEVDGIRVTRFSSLAPFDTVYFSWSMTKALRKAGADIVHAHGFRSLPMLSAALAARENGFRLIVTTHLGFSKLGRVPYLLYNPIFGRVIFDTAQKILLVSSEEPTELPILKSYKDKTQLMPNGIEVTEESFEATYRRKPKEGLRLLSVCRLEKKKGVDTAIRVLSRIQQNEVTLDIVGSGEYSEGLQNLVRKMRLEDRVNFHGRVDLEELMKLYAQSHILLLLSEYESFPMVIIEAMNAGVVPIATRVGDVPYEIGEKAGYVVDYPVNEDHVRGLISNLRGNRDGLQNMAEEGWRRVRRLFDMEVIASKIGHIYESL